MLPEVCTAPIETWGAAAVAELKAGAVGAVATAELDESADFLPRKLSFFQGALIEGMVQPTTKLKTVQVTTVRARETRMSMVLVNCKLAEAGTVRACGVRVELPRSQGQR